MSESTFHESGLQFTFPKDWIVFKYDEHRFYRYLSGEGLKGVDFIAIHGEELILIEVKNYTERFYKEDSHPMEAILAAPENYVLKYQRKFEDTFRLIDIIEQYYNRKWWYRNVFQRFFYKKSQIKTETAFWSKAISLLEQPEQVRLVLWLELAPEYPQKTRNRLPPFFQKELQPKLPKGMRLEVVNSEAPFNHILVRKETFL